MVSKEVRPFMMSTGALVGMSILVRLAFMAFMPATYAFDVHAWLDVVHVFRQGGDPYVLTDHLVYFPLWLAILRGLSFVNSATGIPLTVCLQLFLIAVDAVNIILARRLIVRSGASSPVGRFLLIGLVLSPMSILLTMQHGNFDALVATWLLLFLGAWYAYHGSGSRRSWLLGCFFLGMGVLTKTVPLVMAPLLLLGPWRTDPRTALQGLLAFAAPTALSLLPFVTTDPQSVVQRVLAYHSVAGWFGITGLLGLLGADGPLRFYVQAAPLIMLGLMAWATWWITTHPVADGRRMLRLVLTLLLGIIVLGPGYSPQYVGWYLPLLVILYAVADSREQMVLAAAYVVGTCTHVVEYALIPSHGAFLLRWTSDPAIVHLSDQLRAPGAQTVLRIPLFLAYIATLFVVSRPLFARISTARSAAR